MAFKVHQKFVEKKSFFVPNFFYWSRLGSFQNITTIFVLLNRLKKVTESAFIPPLPKQAKTTTGACRSK
jgi:tRNA(Glu) U13 pseudouridine synthase TruD